MPDETERYGAAVLEGVACVGCGAARWVVVWGINEDVGDRGIGVGLRVIEGCGVRH